MTAIEIEYDARVENAAYKAELAKKVEENLSREGIKLQRFDPEMLVRRGNYLVLITPEIAADLLERNVNNRKAKRRAIAQYARDMLAAQWNADASDIKIGRNGDLLDGQNRLMACIESGAPFPTLLRTGLDPDSRDHVDQGVRRTAGDTFGMMEIADPNNKATAINIRARYERTLSEFGGRQASSRTRRISMTHAELKEYWDSHPTVERMARLASQMYTYGPGVPKSVYIAAMSIFAESSEKLAREFGEKFVSGETSGTGDPMLALTRYLARAKSPGELRQRSQNRNIQHLAAFVIAWNAWVQSESLDRIHVRDGDILDRPV